MIVVKRKKEKGIGTYEHCLVSVFVQHTKDPGMELWNNGHHEKIADGVACTGATNL